MTDRLKYLIEQVLDEQWAAMTSSHFFGKDRNGGNVNPEEWNDNTPKAVEYQHKLRNLEPVIRQSQQYKLFLRDFSNTNPGDEASLFGMYENFLGYFGIKREEFQDGDDDDRAAALAVASYFKSHPDRLG